MITTHMNNKWIIPGAILGVLLILAMMFGGAYNSLVTLQENVKGQWSQVQTQYQRRVDLVPNLVNTVKGSAQFEQSTLQAVVEARSAWAKAQSGGTVNEQVRATQNFDSALSRLLVTVEAYPQLRSTEAFRDLMTQLEGTENRIAVARRDYNEAVKTYNTKIRTFPTNLVAGMLGFDRAEPFESQEGADKAPQVDFTK